MSCSIKHTLHIFSASEMVSFWLRSLFSERRALVMMTPSFFFQQRIKLLYKHCLQLHWHELTGERRRVRSG